MKVNYFLKRSASIFFTALLVISLGACSNQKNESESTVSQQSSEASKSVSSDDMSLPSTPLSSESGKTETDVPSEWQDNGIFSQYYDDAYKKVKNMSIDEKIGQMLFARCPQENAVETAQKYHLGGYVLFGKDFKNKTKDEVISDITSYKQSQQIPMSISADEEGGTVVRISSNPNLYDHEFLSPRDIFANGGMDAIKSDAKEKANLLSSLYIDTNLAPVCDISVNESDFMYDRSLGQDAQTTGEYAVNITEISQKNGVSVTLKHFPGYGNNVDTHTGIAIDERDYSEFENNDFIPFEEGIKAGAHMVMVNHNIVKCMDAEKPASISANVHNILRNKLGFTGIIVTDDLSMDAITEYSGKYSPAVTAVLAGNDMLTISDIETPFNDIKQAVNDGIIDESIIDHAAMRILAWKYAKGMINR